ncbi:MAG TPA: aconitate hydratase, partial [Burkholderiales bacterium]|nr:aconitate hydratase [Burkholderiales bacterium]
GTEGSAAVHQPSGEPSTIYEAAMRYQKEGVPLLVFAGEEYGTGSSRDWAAKGTQLLGVKAVIARGFERIHRNNLVGMGVLPCQFKDDTTWQSLGIDGSETFDLIGIDGDLAPMQDVTLVIRRGNGTSQSVSLLLRIDTPIEVDYFRNGGILPFVLRQIVAAA